MTKKRKRHTPEQIVMKFWDAGAIKNAGNELGAVLRSPRSVKRHITVGRINMAA